MPDGIAAHADLTMTLTEPCRPNGRVASASPPADVRYRRYHHDGYPRHADEQDERAVAVAKK